MDILTVTGLTKRFGEKEVLRGLELAVPANSIFGFMGRNGAGKTTTMKAILGLLAPDGGEIRVAGERVCFGATPTNRHVGYLPDVPEFYPFLNATEYLTLCGESLGMQKKEVRDRVEELLSLVGLAGETHRIKGYSRGMKQRLGIAQALLGRPKLLICDEPTSALDPVGRKEILELLLSVRAQTTVLFSTHILADVERICTDVALLHEGKIAMQGSVEALKRLKRREEFAVEATDSAALAGLKAAFPEAQPLSDGTLLFAGDEAKMHTVMAHIAENGISVRRVERTEASLEALFMEVTNA